MLFLVDAPSLMMMPRQTTSRWVHAGTSQIAFWTHASFHALHLTAPEPEKKDLSTAAIFVWVTCTLINVVHKPFVGERDD